MKEEDVGITEYTTPDCKGFVGILKQRFSDFVVREITLDGEVLFLKDIDGKSLQESIFGKEEAAAATVLPPEEAAQGTIDEMTKIYPTPISAEDIDSLRTFLNGCHSKDAQVTPTWTGLPCDDKAVRGNLHKAIRVHSSDYVESTTEQINDVWHIKLHAKHLLNTSSTSTDPRGGGQNNNRNNNNNRQQGGFVKRKNFQAWPADKIGDYLRFTLMKENVDTISAVNNLNKVLHIKANNICYNGTKDKRGITIQHCTIYRKKPLDFLRINRYFGNPFVRIGDFQYVAKPARLGDLAGNRFEIVLRNVQGDEANIVKACEALRTVGFINYYGLQRFGKTYAGATHKIGRAVLLSDWQQCIEAMFEAPPADIIAANGGDELADVRRHYQAGKFEMAAMLLPQSMYREREILLRLAKTPSDFAGAFNTMGRNLRLMYVHAYQSALWNRSVSERLKRFGYHVVVGDLVRVRRAATEGAATAPATVTGAAAPVPESAEAADDEAAAAGATEEDDVDDGKYAIHRVTEEDVAQGTYSVYEVVLPLLGSESLLPGHEIATFMLEQLEADGLRSDTFATCHPAYRLKGNYRLMLQLPGNLEYALVRYRHPDEEINATELQQYRNLRPESTNGNNNNNNHKKRDISTATVVATVDGEQPQAEGEPAAKKARVEDEQPANDNDTAATAAAAVTTTTATVSAPVAAPSTATTDAAAPSYLAVTLKFSLQSGCYATMLLREVMKMSTETAHHAMLTSAAVSK